MNSRSFFRHRRSIVAPAVVGAITLLSFPHAILAASTSGSGTGSGNTALPWEGPLNQVLTSFTGASAAPSQAPAASPQNTPTVCRWRSLMRVR